MTLLHELQSDLVVAIVRKIVFDIEIFPRSATSFRSAELALSPFQRLEAKCHDKAGSHILTSNFHSLHF
jgi:hypothetical protein